MCGIAGIVDFRGGAGRHINDTKKMVDVLSLRGPDEVGFWRDEFACLGHSRLAIIDPSSGQQPIGLKTKTDSMWMVFSGEIYNYLELAGELRQTGYRGSGSSDTEVLLEGFRQHGVDFVKKLRGMFAIALWDGTRKKLWLIRDPLGVKPLYFTMKGGAVAFGSEPKALLISGLVSRRVNSSGMQSLLSMWPYKAVNQSIFADIGEVSAAEVIEFTGAGKKSWRYWDLAEDGKSSSYEDAVSETREILNGVMEMQSRSDVGMAFSLSGGLDSTALAFLHAELDPKSSMRTYSMGFHNPDEAFAKSAFRPELDEPYIKAAVSCLGSKHQHFSYGEKEIFEAIKHSLRSRDLPDTGDLDSTLFLFFRDIAEAGEKVCISGEGADEIFGGYPWPSKAAAQIDAFPWSGLLNFWPGALSEQVNRRLCLPEFERKSFEQSIKNAPKFEKEGDIGANQRLISYLELKLFLGGQLDRMDRASMANSVEVRVPYCDHVLVQHVWQLEMKHKTTGQAKQLLRDAAPIGVPQTIRERAKASYPTMGSRRYQSELEGAVLSILEDQDWALSGWLDRQNILDAIDGKIDTGTRPNVWMSRLLALYRWVKTYDPDISEGY